MSVEGAFIVTARSRGSSTPSRWGTGCSTTSTWTTGAGPVASMHLWRAGADEALYVPLLDAASRSLKESEAAALIEFAGLPRPELNVDLELPGRTVIGDLVYRELGVLLKMRNSITRRTEGNTRPTSTATRLFVTRGTGISSSRRRPWPSPSAWCGRCTRNWSRLGTTGRRPFQGQLAGPLHADVADRGSNRSGCRRGLTSELAVHQCWFWCRKPTAVHRSPAAPRAGGASGLVSGSRTNGSAPPP